MKLTSKLNKTTKGQALTSLLAFTAMAIIVTTGAITVSIINATAGDNFSQGNRALYAAQAGAENAVLKLLRDENYTGTIMQIDSDQVDISVTGSATKTINSQSAVGSFKRKVEVIGNFNNNVFTVISWKEIN